MARLKVARYKNVCNLPFKILRWYSNKRDAYYSLRVCNLFSIIWHDELIASKNNNIIKMEKRK